MDGAARTTAGDERPPLIEPSERGEKAFARATRHSRRVRALKIALPAVAMVITLAFVGYSVLASTGVGRVDFGGMAFEDGDLVMSNPKLDGFTSDDLPYKMTAARARQAVGDGTKVELEEIRATLPIDEDDTASVTAASGTFDRERNTLDIDSPLTMTTTSGIVARLQSANVDIDDNSLATDKPVEIEMEGTRITADSMHTVEGGDALVFENRVRVHVDPERYNRDVAAAREIGSDE